MDDTFVDSFSDGAESHIEDGGNVLDFADEEEEVEATGHETEEDEQEDDEEEDKENKPVNGTSRQGSTANKASSSKQQDDVQPSDDLMTSFDELSLSRGSAAAAAITDKDRPRKVSASCDSELISGLNSIDL